MLEPFYLNIDNDVLTVQPEEDGTYTIYKDDVRLAHIFCDIGIDLQVNWETSDLIPKEFAQKIGDAIVKYEM